jgi:hypothetical protein
MAGNWWTQLKRRTLGQGVLNQLLSKNVLDSWSKELSLSIEYVYEALRAERLRVSVSTIAFSVAPVWWLRSAPESAQNFV